MTFPRVVCVCVCILSTLSHVTCYVLLFSPQESAEQIEFIGRNSLSDENIIIDSSINPENLRGKSAYRTREGTHHRQIYNGESNRMEEDIGKAQLNEIQEEEDGWNSRVMVNGKVAHLDRPAGQLQQQEGGDAGAIIRTWLIHYCRLHPKCNLETLLAEL